MRSRQLQKSSCAGAAALGQAGDGALERVAVRVHDAGQHRSASNLGTGRASPGNRRAPAAKAVGARHQQHVLRPAAAIQARGAKKRRASAMELAAGIERRLHHARTTGSTRARGLLLVVRRRGLAHVEALAHLQLHRVHVLGGRPYWRVM
jgi:hypothetical protein